MSSIRKGFIIFSLMSVLSPVHLPGHENSLKKLYGTGKVKFVKEFVISDKSLHGGLYFENPNSLAIDADGNVYVCDGDANHIKKFNKEGKFIETIGRSGAGPGEFGMPGLIEVSKDRLVLWESVNRRISVLNLEGKFIKGFRFSGANERPMDIKGLPGGQIIIEIEKTDFSNEKYPQECRIDLYSPDMEFIKTIYSRKLYRAKPIMKPRVSVPQPFNPMVHWDVSPEGRVVIGFSAKYEIEVFDPLDGKILSFFHKYTPVKVNNKDKEDHFSKFWVREFKADGSSRIRIGAPDYIANNTEFPKYKPAFNSIIIDSEENIWVHTYKENRDEENRYFDVFDKEGQFINHVRILGETRFQFFKVKIHKNHLWQIETDKEDFHTVVKYRISG